MSFVVAIDGPAAAGKGTIASRLAEIFEFSYLDTGLLYRAVALNSLESGIAPEIVAKNLNQNDLDKSNLRNLKISREASRIAVMPNVRLSLQKFQKNFAKKSNGAILDGRDIGTIICPNADIKLFISATVEVRAKRRYLELCTRSVKSDLKTVTAEIVLRDDMDSKRDHSPMIQAADAFLIDTSYLSINQAVALAEKLVKKTLAEKK